MPETPTTETPTTITTDATPDLKASREQAAAEFDRVAKITSICANHPDYGRQAILNGTTAAEVELHLLRASRPTAPAVTTGGNSYAGDRRTLACSALMLHMGHDGAAVKAYGERTVQAASELKCSSLVDVLRAAWPTGEAPRDKNDLIRAAFSQSLTPDILSNVANKLLEFEWASVPILCRTLSKKVSAADFKQHKLIRLTATDSAYEELAETGEIRHGSLGEESTSIQVKTYAKMLAMTRNDIVNDDLGAFDELPRVLTVGAAQTMERAFWTMVLGGTGTGFHADGRGNLIDNPLSLAGLAAAVSAMRKMVDAQGEPVLITPRYLVTGPELESTADAIFASTQVVATGVDDAVLPKGNPLARKYQPQVSPHVGLTAIGGDDDTWFLFSQPTGANPAAYAVAYLNGVDRPTIEVADVDFNRLGMQIRGVLDLGFAEHDYRAVIRSSGDGEE